MPSRLELQHLTTEQVAPLETLFTPQWPEVWRDFAHSFYVTLLEHVAWPGMTPEQLAVQLVHGVVRDLGGTQPYITVGSAQSRSERNERAISLLRQGKGYRTVAKLCGLTESRVRSIERGIRRARFLRKP